MICSSSWVLPESESLFKRKNVFPFQNSIEHVVLELEFISLTHLYIHVCKTQMALVYRNRLHAKQN